MGMKMLRKPRVLPRFHAFFSWDKTMKINIVDFLNII